eukprot:scaffold82104_cov60-Phaeocystis_antarctica.AAC.2
MLLAGALALTNPNPNPNPVQASLDRKKAMKAEIARKELEAEAMKPLHPLPGHAPRGQGGEGGGARGEGGRQLSAATACLWRARVAAARRGVWHPTLFPGGGAGASGGMH